MPRRAEPSFELKTIIWDIAAAVGKGNLTQIHRQLDYDLEKRRKAGDFFEDTPDSRTIKRIVNEDIDKLPQDVAIAKLPRHVWRLRNNYDAIVKLAGGGPRGTAAAEQDRPRIQVSVKRESANREIYIEVLNTGGAAEFQARIEIIDGMNFLYGYTRAGLTGYWVDGGSAKARIMKGLSDRIKVASVEIDEAGLVQNRLYFFDAERGALRWTDTSSYAIGAEGQIAKPRLVLRVTIASEPEMEGGIFTRDYELELYRFQELP